MSTVRVDRIRALIATALDPAEVEVVDDSARHAGHAGARDGAGHFIVRVVSHRFEGLAPLARHRLVYAAVSQMMPAEIHALNIRALTPSESSH